MIRVGLVGFGMGGRVFHAPLIASVEGLELAAVYERTTSNAAARYPGITTYRTLDELLDDSSLELIVVSTPVASHFELAKQVIAAGKHLVVDKPVASSAEEIAELYRLARDKGVLLIPYNNRRWDSDYLTVKKLLAEGSLGRLVSFESRFDRWRPTMPTDRVWKEDPVHGGIALDLGTHICDQALQLFGKPLAVSADILRERDCEGSADSMEIRLRYPGTGNGGLTVTLGGNGLSLPAGPRFLLRGTKGNYIKRGVDPQEAALAKVTRIEDPKWGQVSTSEWGELHLDLDGSILTQPLRAEVGDYRQYYIGVRDALLGNAAPPVLPVEAWRVAQVLDWAIQSSNERREIVCDWSQEPTA